VWFRNRRARPDHVVGFTYGGTHSKPMLRRLISAVALNAEEKWSRFPAADVRPTRTGPKLADFFSIKRGLATGDNRFFIMTREEAVQRQLPWEFFKPILPGPRHLPSDEIEADDDGYPKIERRLFILDCRLPESEVKERHPVLWDYLQTGKPDVSERYLCR